MSKAPPPPFPPPTEVPTLGYPSPPPAKPKPASQTTRTVPVSIDPCLEKREPGEPMFILLARDSAATETIEAWCRYRTHEIEEGTRPDTSDERNHIAQVMAKAEAFRAWRKVHR